MSDTLLIAASIAAITAVILTAMALVSERRTRAAGRRAQNRFAALMDASGLGVITVDGDGRISYANAAAVDTLGYPRAQLVGHNKHNLLHSRGVDEAGEVCPLQEALEERRRYIGHDHFVDIRGNLVPVSVSAAPLDEGNGGSLILFRDRSTEVAEERQRQQAFALISHEVRSPLTTVVGFSQRLQRAVEDGRLPVDEQFAEEIALLSQEAVRMRDIVTVVLDIATVDRRLEFEEEPILVARLAQEEADRVVRQIPGACFVVTGDRGLVVESDDRYVRRVVQNLMENAVKYGGTEQPVEVTVEAEDGGVAVTVRDHGPGIPRDAQVRIFDRFYRQKTTSGSRPGLGLGLFLGRRLADRLGGRISVQSEVGEGAAFTFWLPATLPQESERPDEPQATTTVRW